MQHHQPSEAAFTESHTRLRAPLILLAEDSEEGRTLYAEYLELSGFQVETASDGNEAVSKALSLIPDFIFMDLTMPGLDGWEATRLLRSYERTRAIPIVALTGRGDTVSVARALSAGCLRVLPKPCEPEDLERVICLTLDEWGEDADTEPDRDP